MPTPSSVALNLSPDGSSAAMDAARQQFQEQIDFFKAKLNLPSKCWDDIWQAENDRGFIVAGAQKADLLADLRAAVDKSVAGQSIGDFRKQFEAAVAKSGWSGWTGEGTTAGRAWRTRIIYQTNIISSYAAGRWRQLNDPELLAVRPFWRYIHRDGVLHPRPKHKEWGDSGLTLRHDHPFWLTHFPPNGWGCHCSVQAVRGPKAGDATTPPEGWDSTDAKTGAPPGIDKGWAYAPGVTWHPNLDKYPFDLAREVVADNLKDGVFERWLKFIDTQVEVEKVKPQYIGLTGSDLSMAVRKALSNDLRVPVAVLDAKGLKALNMPVSAETASGFSTHTIYLSDDTAIKQTMHHTPDELPAGKYLRLQDAIDQAQYVEVKKDTKMIYFHQGTDWVVAVIKATQKGDGLFLVSMYKTSQREVDAAIQTGRAIKWEH